MKLRLLTTLNYSLDINYYYNLIISTIKTGFHVVNEVNLDVNV